MGTDLPTNYAERVRGVIVSAAVGDALGWPQESRSNIVGGQKARAVPAKASFRSWDRNSGTQYARYRETVNAGEYSDDTQLLLAVARSCLVGERWRQWLTRVELPTWLLYPRGAGRAVISAARAWADGHPPWVRADNPSQRGPDAVTAYFKAGANGAAMRVAPHVIVTVADDAATMLVRVVADSIATHGHPRALVGATAHALALRHVLLRHGILEYGDLIETLLEDRSWQDADWLLNALPDEWIKAFESTTHYPIMAAWKTTVDETRELLQIASRSLGRAALANDEHTLEALGCYDRTRNGSGTITAIAAAYVATRAAARPLTGLLRTAFLPKADTDTLASMTASLLGAIHGTDWISSLAQTVQDRSYLQAIGTRLAEFLSTPSAAARQPELFHPVAPETSPQITTESLSRFLDTAFSGEKPPANIPDGRRVESSEYSQLETTGRIAVRRLRLRTEDSQSFIIDRVTRLQAEGRSASQETSLESTPGHKQNEIARRRKQSSLKVTLRVSDLSRSLQFYQDILGLVVENTTDESAYFENGLALTAPRRSSIDIDADYDAKNVLVTILVHDFDRVANRVRSSNLVRMIGAEDRGARRQLRVRDPDGHQLRLLPC